MTSTLKATQVVGNTVSAGSLTVNGSSYTAANSQIYLNGTDNAAFLTAQTVFGAAPAFSLTDAATIAVNCAAGFNFTVQLSQNRTLGNPTNVRPGQMGTIRIVQDGSGNRTLSYASNWKFAGGTAPTLTTAANAVDILSFYAYSNTFIYATLAADVK